MTQLVDVKVKDQYSQTYNVKAQLRQVPENSEAERLDLFKRIEHIVVDGEVILPSIEVVPHVWTTKSLFISDTLL